MATFPDARTARDRHARAAFAAEHPVCAQRAFPATVLDTPANMAWEPAADAEVKDRYERRLCRAFDRAARQQLGPDAYSAALETYWRSVATLDNAVLRARAAAELDGLAARSTANRKN